MGKPVVTEDYLADDWGGVTKATEARDARVEQLRTEGYKDFFFATDSDGAAVIAGHPEGEKMEDDPTGYFPTIVRPVKVDEK